MSIVKQAPTMSLVSAFDRPAVDPSLEQAAPDHANGETPLRFRAGCRPACSSDPGAEWHHARLTAVETDPDALLELLELAVTWHELDYSEVPLVTPDRWPAFVENHHWADPVHVERIFRIATDIVRAGGCGHTRSR